MPEEAPPAKGIRLQWAGVPDRVKGALERHLQSKIASATVYPGGFSPGFAGKIVTADNRGFFVKTVSPAQNPDTPSLHRRESRVVGLLPPTVPVPRLLWTYDEGEGGWILLLLECVEGRHPRDPWTTEDLDRVLHGMAGLAAALTPSPITTEIAGTARDAVAGDLRGWTWLREALPTNLDPWSKAHLVDLVALEEQAPDAVDGDTLLHIDIRADNVLLDHKRVWFLDWPHACIGAAWLDLVAFAPSVAMQGWPPPETLVRQYAPCRGADAHVINAGIATVAGFFTHR